MTDNVVQMPKVAADAVEIPIHVLHTGDVFTPTGPV